MVGQTYYYVSPNMMKGEIHGIWEEITFSFPLQKYGVHIFYSNLVL